MVGKEYNNTGKKFVGNITNAIYSEKGLSMKRLFTKNDRCVYNLFEYTHKDSVIRNNDGSVVYEIKQVEVPVSWSQMATDILAQKYLRKKGVPQINEEGEFVVDKDGNLMVGAERSVKQVVNRMAGCWTDWGVRTGYFKTEEDAIIFYDELAFMLLNQMCAPNSPQWFNTGLFTAYGIKGEAQGHFYVDDETG